MLLDDIPALFDTWLLGEAFLRDVFPIFQQLKKQTVRAESAKPYLYEYYNITPLYSAAVSTTRSIMARVHNELVTELNKKDKLPRYLLIILDKDLIEAIDYDEFGVGQLFYDQLNWFAKNVEKSLDLRKDDIKHKNPGALWSDAEPRVIWLHMLVRPFIEGVYKPFVFAQCKKFNDTIDEIASNYKHSHVMSIKISDEKSYFDRAGNLTLNGKVELWREVNITMRAFDRNKIDLKPQYPKRSSSKRSSKPPSRDRPNPASGDDGASNISSYKSSNSSKGKSSTVCHY